MQVELKSMVLILQVCWSQVEIHSESSFSTFYLEIGVCLDA